jgi:hypothetical protein
MNVSKKNIEKLQNYLKQDNAVLHTQQFNQPIQIRKPKPRSDKRV